MSDLLKRRGIVKISRPIIGANPEEVLEALKDVLVVSLENDFMSDTLIYKGYSKRFDLVENGEVIPNYIAEVQRDRDIIKVTLHREKEYTEKDVKTMIKELQESFRREFNGETNG